MKKIITTTFVIIVSIILLYLIFFVPYGWKINDTKVKDISLNGHNVNNNQIADIVKEYNNMFDIKEKNNLEGSTPKYVITINLNSNLKINIQDVGKDNFIVDTFDKSNHKSYWARSKELYGLMEKIDTKNLYK